MKRHSIAIALLIVIGCAPSPERTPRPSPVPAGALTETIHETIRSDFATRAKIARETAAAGLQTEAEQAKFFDGRVQQVRKQSGERIGTAMRQAASPGGTFDPPASRKAWLGAAEAYERISK